MTTQLTIQTLIAMCSAALNKPVISSCVILGDLSISGTMIKVESLADSLQVAVSAGAKKVLIPMISASDLPTVPPELISKFQLIFCSSAEDAVFKGLGVE